jgi:hypothetical protein
MQWSDVLARLNDLPSTFLRQGPNFTEFQNSLVNGLHKFTNGTEGAINQAQPTQAIGRWLDVVGRARNIPRFNNEADAAYLERITYLLTTPGGPPSAILGLLGILGLVNTTLTENFATCSWSASISSGLGAARLSQITTSLGYVRPAGVPYNLGVSTGGLYLNTLNYLGRPRVTGAYLVSSINAAALNMSTNTNNAICLLPTTYLTDPTLNPSLATA